MASLQRLPLHAVALRPQANKRRADRFIVAALSRSRFPSGCICRQMQKTHGLTSTFSLFPLPQYQGEIRA